MAKEIKVVVKLQLEAGKATSAPPVGPILGQHGINLMEFCKQYNALTSSKSGIIPVVATVYKDRSFEIAIKTPPVSELIKKELGISSGSKEPHKVKVGTLSRQKALEIAREKLVDLNAYNEKSAIKMIQGTARSMGVVVE